MYSLHQSLSFGSVPPSFEMARKPLLILLSLSSAVGLTVLPLGDSITKGCGTDAGPANNWTAVCGDDSGGYRAPLWAALSAAGLNVTMVGTQKSGPSWLPATGSAHEGHPGWTIKQILNILPSWAALKPDIILLLLGTNDIGQGHPETEVATDMIALLNATVTALPASRIIISTVLNMVNSAHPEWPPVVSAFNAQLPSIAQHFGATIADLAGETGLCTPNTGPLKRMCSECNGPVCQPAGSYDRVHPTAAGYSLMAGAWAAALNLQL
jgi:lysophospholipase L1-like esterase